MNQFMPVLAEASATIHYKLTRLQTFTQGEWWHWLALVASVLAVAAFVVWMYRKDSVELPRGLAILLCVLRLAAFAGILFFFFGLEKRAERRLVKNSRAILLIDTSQSMGIRDSDSSNVPAAMSRLEHVVAELSQGKLIESLRKGTTWWRIGSTRAKTRSRLRHCRGSRRARRRRRRRFRRPIGYVRWCGSRGGWCMWRRGCWVCLR